MSTHSVKVVRIGAVVNHPNADALDITYIDGWQCVVRKGAFGPGELGIYIEPDYVVDVTREPFRFLDKGQGKPVRIRAKRLRGEVSYGLLLEADGVHNEGDDVMDFYGIKRYEPPVNGMGTFNAMSRDHWPDVDHTKFDIENLQRVPHMFADFDEVMITEKIHGANARYVWQDGKLHIGSRTQWLKIDEEQTSWWHRALTPNLIMMCQQWEGVVFFGEVYGSVQSLRYGCKNGEVRFALFAARDNTKFFPQHALFMIAKRWGVEHVPMLYRGPFSREVIERLAEQDSDIGGGGHMREGVVVTRVALSEPANVVESAKYISTRYWEGGK